MRPFPSGQPQFRTVRARCSVPCPVPCSICSRHENRSATMSVSAAAARTVGSSASSPIFCEVAKCSGLATGAVRCGRVSPLLSRDPPNLSLASACFGESGYARPSAVWRATSNGRFQARRSEAGGPAVDPSTTFTSLNWSPRGSLSPRQLANSGGRAPHRGNNAASCHMNSRGHHQMRRAAVETFASPMVRNQPRIALRIGTIAGCGHSITSSARCSRDCGIVMPRPLAVLTLTISWNFVGCSIGKSPGRAPFRILSMIEMARRPRSSRSAP